MYTENQNNMEEYEDDEIVLDLSSLLEDYVRCLKRCWLQLLLVLLTVTALVVAYFNRSYEPFYEAKLTYAVERTGDAATDASIAKRLSLSVPSVTALEEFRQDLTENIQEKSLNHNYQFSSVNTEGSNLFTVYLKTNNYKNTNLLMENFKEIYPKWASEITGIVELQIADESLAGKNPSNPYSLPKSAAMGLLAGAALCFVIATVYAFATKTVRRESDMKKLTVKGCIAMIPEARQKKRMKGKKGQLLITNKHVDWGFKQAMLTAQNRIVRQMEKENKHVLLVSSTIPEEGKSLLALNIALGFSVQDKKVLVIDGDFRNPSIGKILGLEENHHGLADYFKQKCFLNDIIQSKNNLDVICGGSVRDKASSVLKQKEMEHLMETLVNDYDYIVIDTPPSALFTDAALLSEYADSVLYVVRHDRAITREIRDGLEPFIRNEKLLGYLINRKPGGYSTYGGYGKYSSYKQYGKYKRYIDLDEKSMNTEDSL